MGTRRTQSVAYFSAAADLLCNNKVYHAYFMRVNVAVIKCLKDSRTGILIQRSLQIPHMDVCLRVCVYGRLWGKGLTLSCPEKEVELTHVRGQNRGRLFMRTSCNGGQ